MKRCAWLFALLAVGCTQEAPPAPKAFPAAAPAPAPAVAPAAALSGTVLETLDAPNYTYLRVKTADGERWAAIPAAAIAVGTPVVLANPMPMQHFVSKSLKRTFPEIFFCSGVEGGAAPPRPIAQAVPAQAVPAQDALLAWAEQTPGAAKPTATAGPGAKTVAELHAQRAALKDTTVQVRGTVVKVTRGVLGKNWLHLHDGSGTADRKDDDLVVTTTDDAAIGDVVSVRGPLHLDRDFGAGYFFAVIVEDAKISR